MIRIERGWRTNRLGVRVDFDGDEGRIVVGVTLLLAYMYITWRGTRARSVLRALGVYYRGTEHYSAPGRDPSLPRRDIYYDMRREVRAVMWTGDSIDEWVFWVDIWGCPDASKASDPWWMHWSLHPMDLLFGRIQYSKRVLDSGPVEVPMPERTYAGTWTLTEYTHRRRRWPWTWRTFLRSSVEVPGGIAHPGKGTTEYNCGDDATYSTSVVVPRTYRAQAEAVGALVASVLGDRREYPL